MVYLGYHMTQERQWVRDSLFRECQGGIMFIVYFVALVPILGSFPAYHLFTREMVTDKRNFDPMQFMMNMFSIIVALPLLVSYHKELQEKQTILANIRLSSDRFATQS
jgi:hypothetical protein